MLKLPFVLSALAALTTSAPIESIEQSLIVRNRALAPRQGPPLSGGVSVLDTANQWRSAYNLNTFIWDSNLAFNASQTGQNDGGLNEIHSNVQGGEAQVIAPGSVDPVPGTTLPPGVSPFDAVYTAGWLCEVPGDPELANVCGPVNQVMNFVYSGAGHHDILTDPQYTAIGCSFTQNPSAAPTDLSQGLWICNLGSPASASLTDGSE